MKEKIAVAAMILSGAVCFYVYVLINEGCPYSRHLDARMCQVVTNTATALSEALPLPAAADMRIIAAQADKATLVLHVQATETRSSIIAKLRRHPASQARINRYLHDRMRYALCNGPRDNPMRRILNNKGALRYHVTDKSGEAVGSITLERLACTG
ncbi:hypothetical protein [Larsenimonas rhizosphaerae]|uniref:Uncharacterized protein n=1 Tax=Larsenimonas rhizosphaerae TaxID=2944682 RepID=A0AA41ZJ51_9GAMM|nr:hypothetical protein [Larsenimonas rhizosphaerae]MCX2524868.1 hypothetical protein [Larsenimonas rhizosphaerae]